MNKIKYLAVLAILGVAAIAVAAAEVPLVSTLSVSSTSRRSFAQQAGYVYIKCDQATHFKVGDSSVAALATDGTLLKDEQTPVLITSTPQYVALKTNAGTGICRINRYTVDTGDLTANGAFPSAPISGNLSVSGDAGVAGSTKLSGPVNILGNITADTTDAGFNKLTVISATIPLLNAYIAGQDAGLNNLTLTGNLSDNGVRGQNINMGTSDAGFSGLYASRGNFGGTPGAGGVVLGIASTLPGIWLGVDPASVSTSNYKMLTAGNDTILNEAGGGFSFRSSNSEKVNLSTAGVIGFTNRCAAVSGASTCNQPAGRNWVSTTTAISIANSVTTSTDSVYCSVASGVCTSMTCQADAGQVLITPACTGNALIDWELRK